MKDGFSLVDSKLELCQAGKSAVIVTSKKYKNPS